MNFKKLHYLEAPLLVCNIWDVTSAKIAENLGFQAIGTSSAAIATMLGFEDGEKMSFSDLCDIVERVKSNTNLPLTVDIESGYSREPHKITENIKKLAAMGVVGINIEDSVVEKSRILLDASAFAGTIYSIKQQLMKEGLDVFINVRTDTFLLGIDNHVDQTVRRIQLFEQAGADGIFVPYIEEESDIKTITSSSKLPINVMSIPNLPNFKKLTELGVKRISMGNCLFDHMYDHFKNTLTSVMQQQSFKLVF